MGIEIKQIDLFDTDPKHVLIAHQANCCAVMGAGLALKMAHRYPEAYTADITYHWPYRTRQPNPEQLGKFSFAHEYSDGRWIVNLYGQLRYGRGECHTNYAALSNALLQTKAWMTDMLLSDPANFPRILAVPYGMGCGLAGGDWNIVLKILKTIFEESAIIHLWICKK